ncbi:GntR family transcriptional regulator [Microbaculum marinum]|uniref:GntR family transcriptional regulator n=1 Tax=Microbaculum marinum TaxID=1764581 RepID=A0AAW9RVU6_9HYPH
MLEPVDNTTLQERVYRALKEAILQGDFAPGETLSSRSLASALGTSPMPVRDALVRLRAEGGVEILPNRAARIPVFSRESIEELYDVRLNLEGLATVLATERITDEQIADVEQSFLDMERASDETDVRGFLHSNRLFHFKIYQAASSHHLFPIIEALWLKGGPLLRPFAEGSRAKVRLHEGHEAHAKALQGLKARDAEMARLGIVNDLENAARWFRASDVDEAKPVVVQSK